jgi:hypothetical protein
MSKRALKFTLIILFFAALAILLVLLFYSRRLEGLNHA